MRLYFYVSWSHSRFAELKWIYKVNKKQHQNWVFSEVNNAFDFIQYGFAFNFHAANRSPCIFLKNDVWKNYKDAMTVTEWTVCATMNEGWLIIYTSDGWNATVNIMWWVPMSNCILCFGSMQIHSRSQRMILRPLCNHWIRCFQIVSWWYGRWMQP